MEENLIAAEEAAGESAAIAPDPTPETESEDVVDETPSEEQVEESAETEEVEPAEESEELDFSDLSPNFIPPDEKIEKLRIKPEDRAEYKEVARIARESQAKLDEFGGDYAIDTLKPLATILSKPSADDKEITSALTSIGESNPAVLAQLGTTLAIEALTADNKFTDAVLTQIWGDNASVDNIKTLLALDKQGLIEKDSEYLGFEPTKLSEANQQIAELKKQLEEKREPEVNTKAVKEFETDFYSEIPKKIAPIFERVGWPADSFLAKVVTENVQAKLRRDSKYSETELFLKQTGTYRSGDSRAPLANANLHLLNNMAFAQAQEMVKGIQADRRKLSESSRNRIVKEKLEKPKEIVPQELPKPTDNLTLEQKQNAARERFLAAKARG
jgi:hypothetical protein